MRAWWDFFIDLVFPLFCVGCKREGYGLCDDCAQKIFAQAVHPHCLICLQKNTDWRTCATCRKSCLLDGLIAPFTLHETPVLSKAIRNLKYHGQTALAKDLGKLLAPFFPDEKNICLVPVPLHNKRRRERGYNQAALLAHALGEQLATSVAHHTPTIDATLLERLHYQRPQVGLARAERFTNIQQVFHATQACSANTMYVLLDDVATTSATLQDAARALRVAGAKNVWAIVLARNHGRVA